jgi:hypothetical protein
VYFACGGWSIKNQNIAHGSYVPCHSLHTDKDWRYSRVDGKMPVTGLLNDFSCCCILCSWLVGAASLEVGAFSKAEAATDDTGETWLQVGQRDLSTSERQRDERQGLFVVVLELERITCF